VTRRHHQGESNLQKAASVEWRDVEAFAARVLTIINQTWQEVERPLSPTITVSLACYLPNGQPIQLHLYHDGTAAAFAYGGSGGTVLGIGFC
jgi:hypothetical protein